MVTLFDKRNAKRHGCDGETLWSYFNQKDCFKARKLNYG